MITTDVKQQDTYRACPFKPVRAPSGVLTLAETAAVLQIRWANRHTVKTLNIGTPRPATVVVLNIQQFNITRK